MRNSTYLDAKSVAERYDVSVRSVWRFVRDGRLPPPRTCFGTMRRWTLEELEAWERERFH